MIQDYFQKSKSPFYSFIITLPIFLLYELGLFLMRGTEFSYIKNGADVLIEDMIATLGFDIFYISSSIFLLAFFIIAYYQKKNYDSFTIYKSYLSIMLFESFVYALLLFLLLGNMSLYLMDISVQDIKFNIILSLGAGIYEELIFRVFSIFVLYKFISFIFKSMRHFSTQFFALLLSSILFSLFHFMGTESFSQEAFTIRFIAGILLGILYINRGFGITAITHSFYDIFVIFQLT
ncbi:MAG: CPBP family glutamic-type intramembrane protease [Candidatus Marinimicrobia bacterium]|jgi:membrane protease YdiL (CAAX protease family)|nr:CPBP family glutamic-type intramembrane protease [Candidatus Neomarinimicrobiota bacterium]